MRRIHNLSEIEKGKFYFSYKPQYHKLKILECLDCGLKDIVGDIPKGILRTEMRLVEKYHPNKRFEVEKANYHQDRANIDLPIFPDWDELIYEMDEDEVATHVYFEAI